MKPGQIEKAAFRTAAFSMFTPHTPSDGEDIRRIMQLDAQAAKQGDPELHRRELIVRPLVGTLRQINDNYADHFGSAKKITEWNTRIADFLVTAYGDFSDYLLGKQWSHALNKWSEIDPPRPEQSALVATDIATMLGTLTKQPFARLLTEENKATVLEMYSHLKPHLGKDFAAPSYDV